MEGLKNNFQIVTLFSYSLPFYAVVIRPNLLRTLVFVNYFTRRIDYYLEKRANAEILLKMAHITTISTPGDGIDLDRCSMETGTASKDGKMFFSMHRRSVTPANREGVEVLLTQYRFSRHELISGKTEVFSWDLHLGGRYGDLVNFYSLTSEILVVVSHKGNMVFQHMVQLVASEQTPTTVPNRERRRHRAYTICTRTKTILGLGELVDIGLGLIHSGVLLVTSTGGSVSLIDPLRCEHAHLIASNPFLVDRYPDRDLSRKVMELAKLADSQNFTLRMPMITERGLFYLLTEKGEEDVEYAPLVTHMVGVLYFEDGGKFRVQLETFDNKEVEDSDLLRMIDLRIYTQIGGPGYVYFKCPDWDVLDSLSWCWKDLKYELKCYFCLSAHHLLSSLQSCRRFRLLTSVHDLLRRKYDTVLANHERPRKHYLYAIDYVHLKFRRIPYEQDRLRGEISFFEGTPHGKFFIVSMPCGHRTKGTEFKKTLHVTLLWDPAQPPPLKEIAQRVVMKLAPNYRSIEFKRDYGSLERGEVKREEEKDTVVTSMDTSYSLLDVECGLRSVGLGTVASKNPQKNTVPQRSPRPDTVTSCRLDSTQDTLFYEVDEENEPLLKDCGYPLVV